ncbi:MAG: thymidine phosphorylase family protein [Acidobacteria bacterium]|nr:MAG: thymidine phosphorylase family protein [Acidobacteriota bacterium]REJ98261.1 MAG: thymidine phosphorylase family protein [Acidobacteriota bacterium]REK17005.1 MAG: thymidine phosphorylase family protein [Acidobacteriota bacterium]REK42915.1 MAG: thymidine phosphorylase family protein [Acidobacteriota bacterium]
MKIEAAKTHSLRLKRLGIDSRNEHLVFMRRDCPECKSEGFEALNRIRVSTENNEVVASLVVVDGINILGQNEAGLSEGAVTKLQAREGDVLTFSHLKSLDSMSDVRRKVFGNALDQDAFTRIIEDIVNLNLSNIQVSAFLTACAGDRLNLDEIVYLTRSMIDSGQRLHWKTDEIYDKHCIGGLPGNRTTPIVVSIIAASGLKIPKTSSRAITSPAGTADMMETLTNVDLSVAQIEKIVDEEGGCLAWGGAVQLSPADDILIRVERALDIDSEGQMIASVLSKKAAAGAKAVVIDIPVGKSAKVRSMKDAERLATRLCSTGESIGLFVEPVITDGSQPVGRGIGPALEAKDVLAVLKNEANAPRDLRDRAVSLAGVLLEMAEKTKKGMGRGIALGILESGSAWEKFKRICIAQGGLKGPPEAEFRREIAAYKDGKITAIDNRRIARLAKLAGAPAAPAAGILLNVSIGDAVRSGEKLFELHAMSEGELSYAFDYLADNRDLIRIER